MDKACQSISKDEEKFVKYFMGFLLVNFDEIFRMTCQVLSKMKIFIQVLVFSPNFIIFFIKSKCKIPSSIFYKMYLKITSLNCYEF